jgi:proteasome lid subunit RPN8/RPN11
MKSLVFQTGHVEAMIVHIARCAPEEACGLLAGTGETVKGVFPVTNHLHSPNRFEMDHREQLEVLNSLESRHLELVGIYHSHPAGPAVPSLEDISSFSYPGVVYLIWSNTKVFWTVRGFDIVKGSFSPILLDFPGASNLNIIQGL